MRLQMSGGGLRDHNFDVGELQMARQAFHVLWCCELLRAELAKVEASLLDEIRAQLPRAEASRAHHDPSYLPSYHPPLGLAEEVSQAQTPLVQADTTGTAGCSSAIRGTGSGPLL